MEFKRSWFMNLIIVIQMTVVFVCTMCAASIVAYFYNYYSAYSEYLEKDGDLYMTECIYADPEIRDIDAYSWNLESKLKKAEVISTYAPWAAFFDGEGQEIDYISMAYDRELIFAYEPELKEGRWLNPDREDGIIEAVVMESDYEISIGTRLNMIDSTLSNDGYGMTVEVVGIMEDGERIVGINRNDPPVEVDYRDLYTDYYKEEQGGPVIIMPADNIHTALGMAEGYTFAPFPSGMLMILYDEDISKEELEYNEKILNEHVQYWFKAENSKVKANSIKNIKEKLYGILPIFICVFILVIISGMCSFAISVKKHMRDYTIFSICGMPWEKSANICVVKSALMCIVALVISVLGVLIGSKTELISETTIQVGVLPVLACVLVGVIYVVISAIMPFALINGTSLNSELKSNV